VSKRPEEPAADLEIGGSWRARKARWRGRARAETRADELETEEATEHPAGPDSPRMGRSYGPVERRWRFSGRLRRRRA